MRMVCAGKWGPGTGLYRENRNANTLLRILKKTNSFEIYDTYCLFDKVSEVKSRI